MNIFRLSERLARSKPEDRFTSHLHYLIECAPQIGQGMVDALLQQAGRPPNKFLRSEVLPGSDQQNRPDFLLSCHDFDILCEHKLQSPLGARQLERYLTMLGGRPRRLALISTVPMIVSQEVLQNPNYLRPSASHYLWRDVRGMLKQQDHRLTRDFDDYMRSLSMHPLELPNGWETLFDNKETATRFGEQFRGIREFFNKPETTCTRNPSHLGLQVSKPAPWLHLFYLIVEPVDQTSSGIGQATISARIYVLAKEASAFRIPEMELNFGRHCVRAQARDKFAHGTGTCVSCSNTLRRSRPCFLTTQ